MRNYSGSRAAIFTSPLSPAFGPFLYEAPSICEEVFMIFMALARLYE
jgi:hypothetical protein